MRREKRFVKMVVIMLLSVVAIAVSSMVTFEKMQNEEEMMSGYETKKAKCELLREISREVIEEGVCIDIGKISSDEVEYSIYNDNENIVFCYHLKDDSAKEVHAYNATIIVSNKYRILREEYSIEMESLDEYVETYNSKIMNISIVYGTVIVLVFYFFIYVLAVVVSVLLKTCINKKKKKLVDNYSLDGKDEVKFFGRRYLIHGRGGSEHLLTARELYVRIMEDRKNDYSWIASAAELVRVCRKASFPEKYAIDIKVSILNCFANIQHKSNYVNGYCVWNLEDRKAIQYCYNSLYGIDTKEVVIARRRYLTEMIAKVSIIRGLRPDLKKFQEEWRKCKVDKYISWKEIDFDKLLAILKNDFTEFIQKA